jgi:2-aminoethylphosphonate aminotransferase
MLNATAALAMNYARRHNRKYGVLFTAGPISTSPSVRQAQLDDYGSRDANFVNAIRSVRDGVVDVANPSDGALWTAVPMQGSGTMGIEAIINTIVPPFIRDDRLVIRKFLVIRNGAYSRRMATIAEKRGAQVICFDTPEGQEIDLVALQSLMREHPDVSTVGVVHCETSTGMFNPIHGVAALTRKLLPNATIFVDAMSSFGGVSFRIDDVCDVLVTSANKCVQGVPGFSLVVAKRELLSRCRGNSPSFTLDVTAQFDGLEKSGQFNHTPPVQAIMAFHQALQELRDEGGVEAREARYKQNAAIIADGMTKLGFNLFLNRHLPSFGHIITAYHSPTSHPNWDFKRFYDELKSEGFVIYPGKASDADTFRIGCLGDIHSADCEALLDAVRIVMDRMQLKL